MHDKLKCLATNVYGVQVSAVIPPEPHRVPTFIVLRGIYMRFTTILRATIAVICILTPITSFLKPPPAHADGTDYPGVIALAGTPHLWVIDRAGTRHWAGDTRALSGMSVDWGTRGTASGPSDLGTVGDPVLSAGLLKDGDPIYLVKWETGWDRPVLQHIQSIEDVRVFGISSNNYGKFVIDRSEWERRFGISVDSLKREELPSATTAASPSPPRLAAPPAGAPASPLPDFRGKPLVILLQGFSTSLGEGTPSTTFSHVTDDLSSVGFTSNDVRTYSYKGYSESLAPRPYSCDDVGQPLNVSMDRLEEAVSITQRQWPGRKVVLVGHSYGGLVAIQALTRASNDPKHSWLLDAVSGVASFDAPLYGSGSWRHFVSFVLALFKDAFEGGSCKNTMLNSDASRTILALRDHLDETKARYDTLGASASVHGIRIATIGNQNDALYRPSQSLIGKQLMGLSVVGGTVGCFAGQIPACLAGLGLPAALIEDLSETQVLQVSGIARWLKDLGPGSGFEDSHRIALRDPELRRWALQQAGLPVPSGQPLMTAPAVAVQPTVVPSPRPVLSAPAPVQAGTAPQMVSYTRTVRLTPNGSQSAFGLTLALKQGDQFGASFSEQNNGDIRLYVIAPDGSVAYSAGQVHGPFSTGTLYAPGNGNYVVWFDNGFSLLSGKTISLRVDYPQH